MQRLSRVLLALCLLALADCSYLPDWMGDDEPPPMAGERVDLTAQTGPLKADPAAKDDRILLPSLPVNNAWPQALGNATAVIGNLVFTDKPREQNSASVADGDDFEGPYIPSPVVAEEAVFALDGTGHISAQAVKDIDHQNWRSDALVTKDEDPLIGGGLAYADGTLYAVNQKGSVRALNAKTGALRWKQELKLPVRSAPRVNGDMLFLLTADNQLLALSTATGELRWNHQGIGEVSNMLQDAQPAVRDGLVLVPYSSGEFVALDAASGNQLWSETLQNYKPGADTTLATAASPLMAQGLSIVAANDTLAALDTETGRRVWERELTLRQAPWLSGNTLFLFTTHSQLVALRGTDGVINWVRDLPARSEGTKGDYVFWQGPFVANGKVWMSNDQGKLRAFNPQNGEDAGTFDLPETRFASPVLVGGKLYLLGADATLTQVGQ